MTIRIRPAERRDLPVLARFGLALARVHVELDRRRFVIPAGGMDTFHEFFSAELERPEARLLIADDQGTAVGYAFVRLESASIEALCEPAAWLHDVYVDPSFRGTGVGERLVRAAIESARQLGSSSLMLGVAAMNTPARRFFERLGLRDTMVEMRLDIH